MKIILIFMVLNILDIITTHIGLRISYQIYGNAWYAVGEANPYMDGVIQHWWGILFKLIIIFLFALILQWAWQRYHILASRIPLSIIILFSAGYLGYASIHNTIQILIMKEVIS